MDTMISRSLAASAVVAIVAYLMFADEDDATRLSVSAILAIVAGVFTALFLRPPRRDE